MNKDYLAQPDNAALLGDVAPTQQGLVASVVRPPMMQATAAPTAAATATTTSATGGYKLGNKVSGLQLGNKVATPSMPTATPAPTQPSTPAAPVYTPYAMGNNGYTGWGDADYGAANGQYFWLPDNIKQQIQKNQGNKYYLLAGDHSQATTVDQYADSRKRYLISDGVEGQAGKGRANMGEVQAVDPVYGTREEALKALGNLSDAELEQRASYMIDDVRPTGNYTGDDGHAEMSQASYGTRDEFLKRAGLAGMAGNTTIAFNGASAGNGNTYGGLGASATNIAKTGQDTYQAIVDKTYKNMVQIGNQGPLNDDIEKMLGQVYDQVGAKTAAQQDLVKNALFKYDPRFGVVGNKEFVEAAASANNSRQNGWFQKNAGLVAGLVSLVNPIAGAAVSAAGTVANGGSITDLAKGLAASYVGQYLGNAAGNWAGGALGSNVGNLTSDFVTGAVKGGVGNAAGQLIRSGSLNGKQLLAGTLAGGIGTAAGGLLVDHSNWSDGIIKGVMNAGGSVGTSLALGKKIDPKALGINLVSSAAGSAVKGTFGKG